MAGKRQPEHRPKKITALEGVSILRHRHQGDCMLKILEEVLPVVVVPSSPLSFVFRSSVDLIVLLDSRGNKPPYKSSFPLRSGFEPGCDPPRRPHRAPNGAHSQSASAAGTLLGSSRRRP